MRKRINDSVQKWNHTLKTAFGKIFGYDSGKTVDTCKSHGGK